MCLFYHRPGAWNITWKLEPKQSLHWDPKPWSIYGHTTQNTPGLIWNHGAYTTLLVERRTSLFSFSHPVFQQFATEQTTQKPRERARIMQGINLKASRQLTVQVHQRVSLPAELPQASDYLCLKLFVTSESEDVWNAASHSLGSGVQT